MIVSYFIAKKEGVPKEQGRIQLKPILKCFMESFWALMMPFVIIGSILSGVVSPTEAGVIAVVYGLIVGGLVYKELKCQDIKDGLENTARTCGKIFIIICPAALFTKLLTTAGFHMVVRDFLLSISTNPTVILIIILLIIIWKTTTHGIRRLQLQKRSKLPEKPWEVPYEYKKHTRSSNARYFGNCREG